MPRRLAAAVVATVALTACHKRTASVGSPSPAAEATRATPPANAMPAGVTADMIAEGKTLFEAQTSNCTRCHGPGGKGGQNGPDLTDNTWVQIDGSFPAIEHLILTGVPADKIKGNYRFAMRPKGGSQLSDAQVKSVAAYLYSVTHK
jgi:mono/diheme cytochrome c family protein